MSSFIIFLVGFYITAVIIIAYSYMFSATLRHIYQYPSTTLFFALWIIAALILALHALLGYIGLLTVTITN
jgi:hypothetical protein